MIWLPLQEQTLRRLKIITTGQDTGTGARSLRNLRQNFWRSMEKSRTPIIGPNRISMRVQEK